MSQRLKESTGTRLFINPRFPSIQSQRRWMIIIFSASNSQSIMSKNDQIWFYLIILALQLKNWLLPVLISLNNPPDKSSESLHSSILNRINYTFSFWLVLPNDVDQSLDIFSYFVELNRWVKRYPLQSERKQCSFYVWDDRYAECINIYLLVVCKLFMTDTTVRTRWFGHQLNESTFTGSCPSDKASLTFPSNITLKTSLFASSSL